MKTETYTLEILTPCFCAGAKPETAEIRASSIRGQLRWWFRVLGGTADQEREVFGGVHNLEARASAVVIRIKNFAHQGFWNPPELRPNSNEQYLLYYAKASQKGARWRPQGAVAPGAKVDLEIQFRKPLSKEADRSFSGALSAFLELGAIGLRATRGLGAFACLQVKSSENSKIPSEKVIGLLKTADFLFGYSAWQGNQDSLLSGLGAQLRGLRKGWPASKGRKSNPTPLGSSSPRQSSAVYLRPIRLPDGKFKIFVFEAPHEKVLGRESQSQKRRLADGVPALGEPPTMNRRHHRR